MQSTLALIPALPLAGFLVLALLGGRLGRRGVSLVGVGSVGASAILAIVSTLGFLAWPPAGGAVTSRLWTWWSVGGLAPGIAFTLDPLAIVFTLVVTVVGFLIHLYSTEYMAGDEGYARFFACMNLFVGSMLILVLADNLPLLYLGWEGVGLCSYLLIGFWYRDPANGRAARKAFLVTRVGDTAMALGIFLLFTHLGTLQIGETMNRAVSAWPVGSGLATAAALLLLGGAVGKSAQLPLQTWLPDAMAGPTPVSALIHAATMVTAGVYLIARTHALFLLSPAAMSVVAIVGALTLLLAGCSALVQTDIKRVLAYSTISQIGYMFLALGVGAWSAAILHFMTHAFFKALLFLGAGAVILALHHEQEIAKMGGLRRPLPAVFWTFLIGGASLAALPLVTSGFYSKDAILWAAWNAPHGGRLLWAAGLLGALLTALYTFRLIFRVFFGEVRTPVTRRPTWTIMLPLVVLAALATIGGFVETPHSLGGVTVFSRFLEGTFGAASAHVAAKAGLHPAANAGHGTELALQILAAIVCLGGVGVAHQLFLRRRDALARWRDARVVVRLQRFWFGGWGFDDLYDLTIVRPFEWVARVNRDDFIDTFYTGLARTLSGLHHALAATQTGRVRLYAAGVAVGAILAIAIMVLR
jgi:NADH-quinone oxidoreductase subunit L